jgi:hypothetical protein
MMPVLKGDVTKIPLTIYGCNCKRITMMVVATPKWIFI